MKKPSPEELDKQIAAKTQELQTLQTATKQAQDQWDDQRKQIDSDTKLTIATAKEGIAIELEEARTELKTMQESVKAAKTKFNTLKSTYEGELLSWHISIEELERDKKVLETTNTTLGKRNLELESKITVSQETILDLRGQETQLAEKLVDMRVEETQLQDKLDTLQKLVTTKNEELNTLTDNFNTTKENNVREIGVLEAKKDNLIQEILQNKAQDEKVRDNLADWAKKLEEKDKNLRIREAKTNMDQQAIARNANLLNL